MKASRKWQLRRAGGVRAAVALGACLVAACLATAAAAREIKFPETRAAVTLQVPDDWTVAYTTTGLELRSPEKNSLIVANLFRNDKAGAEAWTAAAADAMAANGIVVDRNAKDKAAENKTKKDKTAKDKTAESSEPPKSAGTPASGEADTKATLPPPTASPGSPAFTFSGAPTIDVPGAVAPVVGTTAEGAKPSISALPPQTGSTALNRIPHKVVNYFGAKLDGKPVDVQLYIYALARDDLFLIEQASGGDDRRAVDIVYSVKRLAGGGEARSRH